MNKSPVITLISLIICISTFGEESLLDKIGVVAAHLLETQITGSNGPRNVEAQAISWDRIFLADGIVPSTNIPASFQTEQESGFDAVAFSYNSGGKSVQTKQTLSVWTVTCADQPVPSLSDSETAVFLNTLAGGLLNGFPNREFVAEGSFSGRKVFSISVQSGSESGDWKDTVVAVVSGTDVTFSCLKKQPSSSQLVISGDPLANKSWFNIANRGSKRK